MAISILEADLSLRTYNALRRAGYSTLEEVASKTRDEIMRVRNLGQHSLVELESIMHANGLHFADEKEEELPMFSHEQLDVPRGFILVHSEDGEVFYLNVDSIAGFSTIEYNDGHRASVITFIYKLTTGERDYITVKETPSELCTLINNARR